MRFLLILLAMMSPVFAQAQDRLTALARIEPGSIISDIGDDVAITLRLSQPVPYRVYYLADPWRVVMEFSEVEWSPISHGSLDQSREILSVRSGPVRPGWSRLVLQTKGPRHLDFVQQASGEDGSAIVSARLAPVSEEDFRAAAGLPEALKAQPVQQTTNPQVWDGSRRLRVVLDPGHGGIDPGAEVSGAVEADLMLKFARELREALVRTDRFDVRLTRDADIFVPLESRVSVAHEFGADVFLSLHADVVVEGKASGTAIYTLAADASDIASQKLAERHSREDLLAGVDLSQQDDTIAFVLMDMARTETTPRTNLLADQLVADLGNAVELYKHPRLEAGFSVLKAPDIPSVLIEIGFMSSSHDLANLVDYSWRARAIGAIVAALQTWADEDAASRDLRRK